jgi:hypothetical protein
MHSVIFTVKSKANIVGVGSKMPVASKVVGEMDTTEAIAEKLNSTSINSG